MFIVIKRYKHAVMLEDIPARPIWNLSWDFSGPPILTGSLMFACWLTICQSVSKGKCFNFCWLPHICLWSSVLILLSPTTITPYPTPHKVPLLRGEGGDCDFRMKENTCHFHDFCRKHACSENYYPCLPQPFFKNLDFSWNGLKFGRHLVEMTDSGHLPWHTIMYFCQVNSSLQFMIKKRDQTLTFKTQTRVQQSQLCYISFQWLLLHQNTNTRARLWGACQNKRCDGRAELLWCTVYWRCSISL